jgi:hypothetical protein
MIQRIQTIYLVLIELLFIALMFIPVLNGATLYRLPLLLVAEFVIAALAVSTIFLYKNRKLQMKLCNVGVLLSLLVFAAVAAFPKIFTGNDADAVFGIGTWLLALNIILFFLAGRGVRKDEALVRSADRLR